MFLYKEKLLTTNQNWFLAAGGTPFRPHPQTYYDFLYYILYIFYFILLILSYFYTFRLLPLSIFTSIKRSKARKKAGREDNQKYRGHSFCRKKKPGNCKTWKCLTRRILRAKTSQGQDRLRHSKILEAKQKRHDEELELEQKFCWRLQLAEKDFQLRRHKEQYLEKTRANDKLLMDHWAGAAKESNTFQAWFFQKGCDGCSALAANAGFWDTVAYGIQLSAHLGGGGVSRCNNLGK